MVPREHSQSSRMGCSDRAETSVLSLPSGALSTPWLLSTGWSYHFLPSPSHSSSSLMRKLYCGGAVTWGLLSTPVLTPVLTPVSGQVLTRTNTYFCCVNTVPYSAFTVSTLEHHPCPFVLAEKSSYSAARGRRARARRAGGRRGVLRRPSATHSNGLIKEGSRFLGKKKGELGFPLDPRTLLAQCVQYSLLSSNRRLASS